jgi:AcrR family transcriptional regulator
VPRRQRLHPEARRSQLLDVGERLFVSKPYEKVLMEDVAKQAGVSRALMYRYFPNKADFFAAVFRRDSARLVEVSAIDPGRPLAEQVLAGLDAHLDYFASHKNNILTANRGALAGDPTIQAIISEQLLCLRDQMLAGLDGGTPAPTVLSVALDGWLAFVRAVCVDWLADGGLTRDEVRDLCFKGFTGILAALNVKIR